MRADRAQGKRPESPPIGKYRRLRRRFYWLLALFLSFVGQRLPLETGRTLGRFLAGAALRLRGREAQRARGNLAIAFPRKEEAERELLLLESTRLLGENLFDALAAPRLTARRGFVRCGAEDPDPRRMLRDLAAEGRGVFVLTGHLGCWELLGGWLAAETRAAGLGGLGVVTGTIHNEPVDHLVQERRRGMGMKVLPREAGAGVLLRHLNEGGVAAVLLDQNTRVANEPAPFFGRPAPTPAGFARIALQRGVPILPLAIARRGDGHEVRCLEPLRCKANGAAARDPQARRELLTACNAALETLIRRNPAEWVWFHRRWEDE